MIIFVLVAVGELMTRLGGSEFAGVAPVALQFEFEESTDLHRPRTISSTES